MSEPFVRKSIPSGVRFDILQRDKMTCQYCGRKAPDIVLNIDHIIPVCVGGSNEPHNLVTACRECNSGKSDKDLGCHLHGMVFEMKRHLDALELHPNPPNPQNVEAAIRMLLQIHGHKSDWRCAMAHAYTMYYSPWAQVVWKRIGWSYGITYRWDEFLDSLMHALGDSEGGRWNKEFERPISWDGNGLPPDVVAALSEHMAIINPQAVV